MKFDIWVFFENLSRIFNFHEQLTRKRLHYMKTNTHFWSYLAEFFLELETFQAKVIEKIKIHTISSIFLLKSYRLWDNVGKYCKAGQATDDNMAHAQGTLHTWGYKQTLRIWNTYSFSMTTLVERTSLSVTLHSKKSLHFILTRWTVRTKNKNVEM